MYELRDYETMVADRPRTLAYLAAIERAVRPGSVVVEIGTGVGYFAVAACRAGAKRVYAIETNPVVELARQVAADNGCADRITFVQCDSRETTLPELGDVLLSDLRGVLPLYATHIPAIVDARARLLRPGATQIPFRDTLWAAPCVTSPSWKETFADPAHPLRGIDRSAVSARIRSDWYRSRLEPDDLIAEGAEWAALDYATIVSPNVAGRAEWSIARDGAADGLAVWFDADFGFGVSLSNAPGTPSTIYRLAFFPFERSIPVRTGDRLTVDFAAHFVNDEYVWTWNTTMTPADGGAPVVMKQSNLAATIVSLKHLKDGAQSLRTPSTG